jgi:hypothetical protein
MMVRYEFPLMGVDQIYKSGCDMCCMAVSAVVTFCLEGEMVTNVELRSGVPLPREGEVV